MEPEPDGILGEIEEYFSDDPAYEAKRVARIQSLFKKLSTLSTHVELYEIGELEGLVEDYVTARMTVIKWGKLIDSDPRTWANLERFRKNRESQWNTLRTDLGLTVPRMNQLKNRKAESNDLSVTSLAKMR